jgi:hypothetical protein
MGYAAGPPIYYDYGSNVVYQDNSVYVNGQDVGTPAQYYQQAQTLAQTPAPQGADQGDWMPLGIFAVSDGSQTQATSTIQLAVNKQGTIRGNSVETTTNAVQQVHGSVDKQTQRAAWTIGDDQSTVYETGIYNLTKDETPVLVHFGADKAAQWLLVRVKQPDSDQKSSQ